MIILGTFFQKTTNERTFLLPNLIQKVVMVHSSWASLKLLLLSILSIQVWAVLLHLITMLEMDLEC